MRVRMTPLHVNALHVHSRFNASWQDGGMSPVAPSDARPLARGHATRHGIARVISKVGVCSRSTAEEWVRTGRVAFDGVVVLDPWFPVGLDLRDRVSVDGQALASAARSVIVLNKPRGLTVSTRDERGRDTVYACLEGSSLPWLAPVGRLDRASEGLLLLGNDPEWAARLTDPASRVAKRYHVQVRCAPGPDAIERLREGITVDGELLRAAHVAVIRSGGRTTWIEFVLHGGRNRQIRRMLAEIDAPVLRLIRIAIGPIELGDLAKGAWRALTSVEIDSFDP